MSESSFTLPFDKISHQDFSRVGGKCASLGDMTQAGVAVPSGFAVTTDAFAVMLDEHELRSEISKLLEGVDFNDIDTMEKVSQEISTRITAKALNTDIEREIRTRYESMGVDIPVAVRSSATAEDLPDASFAGQQDTYLWVVGIDAVLDNVRKCWASLYTARAIIYREKNNIPQHDVLMSVGVQKMVNAKAAGVAMTLDPANGDRTRIVIDSSWGLGETVVSGTVTPDNFVVEKVMMDILNRTVSDKHMELTVDMKLQQAVELDITDERRKEPSLNDEQIIAVAQLAKKLEKQNGCPQDVEWAFDSDLPDGENLVALQSRPETVWSQKKKTQKANPYGAGMMSSIVSTLNTPYGTKK